jgi:hypothetical protein
METFVVRIWVPADSQAERAPAVLRGFVQHARNGGGASFTTGDELLASLALFLGAGSARTEESLTRGRP